MEISTIHKVIDECQRCSILTSIVLQEHRTQDKARGHTTHKILGGTRHTAALRRASMDLTRALADLRQGR